MERSIAAVLIGTFLLRLSTSLTGTMLVYYLADLPRYGGPVVLPLQLGLLAAAFYAAELVLSPPFGILSDRLGHHRVMRWGPVFGGVAVVMTWATTDLLVLGATRLLEGASTAASVPSILGFIAAATAGSVAVRGRVMARFEAATLIGLGAGIVVAGPLFESVGRVGFLVNAGLYAASLLVYRFGVGEHEPAHAAHEDGERGLGRYRRLVGSSYVWLLAPTWIAINACVGIVTSQTLFQLVRAPDPQFADQALMGSVSPTAVSAGLAVAGLAFFAGVFWAGGRFARTRRTTMLLEGIVGGIAIAGVAAVANHGDFPLPVGLVLAAVALGGVFLLAGATPAALGLLADVSEAHPADRGAIMGLYSVFLALGQIVGSLVGGGAAQVAGIDGIVVATFGLLAIALVPLARLREVEHVVGSGDAHGSGGAPA